MKKLYQVKCGRYEEFAVAESPEEAVKIVGTRTNTEYLPWQVTKEVDEIDGYKINILEGNSEEENLMKRDQLFKDLEALL